MHPKREARRAPEMSEPVKFAARVETHVFSRAVAADLEPHMLYFVYEPGF